MLDIMAINLRAIGTMDEELFCNENLLAFIAVEFGGCATYR